MIIEWKIFTKNNCLKKNDYNSVKNAVSKDKLSNLDIQLI